MRPWIDALARGLALWGALAGVAAIAAEAPARIPLEHFVREEAISRVVLSPSGRRLAVLQVGGTGTRQLAIMNLDPLGEARLLAAYADADVDTVRWIDDERLVYEVVETGGYQVRSGGVSAIAVNVDAARNGA